MNAITTTQKQRLFPKQLNLLRDCPRCYWLDSQGVKRPQGPWPTVLGGLDSIIKSYWNKYRGSGTIPPLLGGLEGVPADPRVRPWYDPSTGLELAGYLDACLEVPGPLYVPVDHKTRRSEAEDTHPAFGLQLDVYALLLDEQGRPSAGYGVLIYYIPELGELHEGLPFRVQVETVETDPQRAREWLRKAREVLDMAEPPPASPGCEYCAWVEAVSAYR